LLSTWRIIKNNTNNVRVAFKTSNANLAKRIDEIPHKKSIK